MAARPCRRPDAVLRRRTLGHVRPPRRHGRRHRGGMVKNRDHWTVAAVHTSGALTVTGTTGQVILPADCVAGDAANRAVHDLDRSIGVDRRSLGRPGLGLSSWSPLSSYPLSSVDAVDLRPSSMGVRLRIPQPDSRAAVRSASRSSNAPASLVVGSARPSGVRPTVLLVGGPSEPASRCRIIELMFVRGGSHAARPATLSARGPDGPR